MQDIKIPACMRGIYSYDEYMMMREVRYEAVSRRPSFILLPDCQNFCFLTARTFKHSFDIILHFIECSCVIYASIRISEKNKTVFCLKNPVTPAFIEETVLVSVARNPLTTTDYRCQ